MGSITYSATNTFIAPPGITSVTVQAIGAGGCACLSTASNGGAGGGGGAFATNAVAVTPGNSYTVTIGAGGVSGGTPNGGNSSFVGDTNSVIALGGQGLSTASVSIRTGGQAAGCTPSTGAYSGGSGGAGQLASTGLAGGGGGGATSSSTGGAGTAGVSGGAGGGTTGGQGGTSGMPNGANGLQPGGGGGGPYKGTSNTPGYGGDGQVIVSWVDVFVQQIMVS